MRFFRLKYISNLDLKTLLTQDVFDIDLQDITSGESLIFTLIKQKNHDLVSFLFDYYQFEKKRLINLNYYNKEGFSVLYVALSGFEKEKQLLLSRKKHSPNYERYENAQAKIVQRLYSILY